VGGNNGGGGARVRSVGVYETSGESGPTEFRPK
jgi:hypothetical protein